MHSALGTPPGAAPGLLQELPTGLSELLRDPLLLETYLGSFSKWPWGQARATTNYIALLGDYLLASIGVRRLSARRRRDLLTRICGNISRADGAFSAADLDGHARDVGVDPDEAVDDLLCSRVIHSVAPGCFSFTHGIWRHYFRVLAMTASGLLSTPDGVTAWAVMTDEQRLLDELPFVSSVVADLALRDVLHGQLLRRNAELYLRALGMDRPPAKRPRAFGWERGCLDQLHHGYFDLVEACFPGLKPLLDPWSRGTRGGVPDRDSAATVGSVSDAGFRYYRGFSRTGGPHLLRSQAPWTDDLELPELAPATGVTRVWSNVAAGGEEPESGRRIGALEAISGAIEVVEERRLPAFGWIARERFLELCGEFAAEAGWRRGWDRMTVLEINASLFGAAGKVAPGRALRMPRGAQPSSALLLSANALQQEGFGAVEARALRLPLPDLRDQRPWRYSESVLADRLKTLFQAVACTYRTACERFFNGSKQMFYYAQFPCRALVRVNLSRGTDDWAEICWEPTETWDEPPQIETWSGRARDGHELRMEMNRNACARLERPYLLSGVSFTSGVYAEHGSIVTEFVSDWLKEDLQRLRGWLG